MAHSRCHRLPAALYSSISRERPTSGNMALAVFLLLSLLVASPSAFGAALELIDDTNGEMVTYSGTWFDQDHCVSICDAQYPGDLSQAHNSTWHGSTSPSGTMTLTFTGELSAQSILKLSSFMSRNLHFFVFSCSQFRDTNLEHIHGRRCSPWKVPTSAYGYSTILSVPAASVFCLQLGKHSAYSRCLHRRRGHDGV
jgi:hypothetical protein